MKLTSVYSKRRPAHFLLLVTFLFLLTAVNAQERDSAHMIMPESWKKHYPGIRLGAGIQGSFYSEFGLGMERHIYYRGGYMVTNYYTAFEWVPGSSGKKAVTGVKVGAELVNTGGAGGIEVKYLTDGNETDVMITPKFGFGLGFINLFYGYSFSTNKYPFPNVKQNQVSMVINTNIFFYHWIGKGKGRKM